MDVRRLACTGNAGVSHVIIPVEPSPPGILQTFEELGFHLVQYIETDKDVAFGWQALQVQMFQGLPVHHAFVGDAQLFKLSSESMVYVTQFVP